MEKKYVGIGIAALAAGTGAAVYKKQKNPESGKKKFRSIPVMRHIVIQNGENK